MDVYIQQQKVRLTPKQLIGQGGEAEVYRWSRQAAVKVFKPPNHPDFAHQPEARQAAQWRLEQHQQKLRQFPPNVPARVIAPQDLAYDRRGQQILGYAMPRLDQAELLLRYSQRSFRQTITPKRVVDIFRDLHQTLTQLHRVGVAIGDFNDLNVLVKGTEAYLIDADSFQFGAFPCRMFTARFVDPLRCDPQATQLQLQQPHTPDSDWYAFTVMLMQCLLFVDPYGGVYKPRREDPPVPQAARPLHRLTVFHPAVRYPKPALPYQALPDALLHHFHQVFEQDWRGPFPPALLTSLVWQTCPSCGREHGRAHCPHCAQPQVTPIAKPGRVQMTSVFQTAGFIVYATQSQGQLRWVYWDAGTFYREDGTPLLQGDRLPHLRWCIQGDRTWLGYDQQLVEMGASAKGHRQTVDRYGATPQFAGGDRPLHWLAQGYLWRQGGLGPAIVGAVLAGQTQFWLGPTFGLGFYRAGHLQRAFVFDGHQSGLNDRVSLLPVPGQLLQASCCLSAGLAWLFLTTQTQGQRHYTCQVISAQGQVLATATSHESATTWLAQLGATLAGRHDPCPFCAVDDGLLAATDDSIVRIQMQQGQLTHRRTFAETELYVDASCQLIPGPQGLWVVRDRQIDWLQLH